MFEFTRAIHLDAARGRARARATVPADNPLFADHFPGAPVLPGSIAIELAAQVAGPLAETLSGGDGLAFLTLVRSAKFVASASLPAEIELAAEASGTVGENRRFVVSLDASGERIALVDLVMSIVSVSEAPATALRARAARLASWQEAW